MEGSQFKIHIISPAKCNRKSINEKYHNIKHFQISSTWDLEGPQFKILYHQQNIKAKVSRRSLTVIP